MNIHPIITHNQLQNIFYILEYSDKKALIIDPSDAILCQDFLDTHNLELERILITHEHFDHYDGVPGLSCKEVYAGKIASEYMPISVTHIFEDREVVFEHENIKLKAIFTPGHALGHMMFELSRDGKAIAIFSGDALFQGGVGHTRNGSNEDLYHSIQKFQKYNDDVIIYSGHDYLENNAAFLKQYVPERGDEIEHALTHYNESIYFTSLGEEKQYNPFLTVDKKEFIRLRELRNNF